MSNDHSKDDDLQACSLQSAGLTKKLQSGIQAHQLATSQWLVAAPHTVIATRKQTHKTNSLLFWVEFDIARWLEREQGTAPALP